MSRADQRQNALRNSAQSATARTERRRWSMSKETKFGYGFLLAGVGVPYLIDKLFGEVAALIVAAICTVAGVALLLTAHIQIEEGETRRQSKTTLAWTLTIFLGAAFTLAWAVWKNIPAHFPKDDIAHINDMDFLDVVTGWGMKSPPVGATGGEAYEDINPTKLEPFRNKYQLMVVVRVHDTRIAPFSDRNIARSNAFPIPVAPIGIMTMTATMPSELLSYGMNISGTEEIDLEFHLCLIPNSLDPASVVDLNDLLARGGHVFNPAHGGSAHAEHIGIPLAPPSPNAHAVVSQRLTKIVKDEAHHQIGLRVELITQSDFQTKIEAHQRFLWKGNALGNPNTVSATFVSKDQVQNLTSSINFTPTDWGAFISGAGVQSELTVDYLDRGVKTEYVLKGEIRSGSDELTNLKSQWIKLR